MSHSLDLGRAISLSVSLALALALISAGASSAIAAGPDDDLSVSARSTWGVTASLGVRSDVFHSAGLDAFSGSDDIPERALSLSGRLVGTELSGLGAGVEWDHGSVTTTARGADATLTIDRLTVPIEGRFHVGKRLSVFARVAPGFLRDHATLVDASAPGGAYGDGLAPGGLQQTTWQLAADVSGGLAFRFAEIRNGGTPPFGFWLTAEAGYGAVGAHDLVLGPHVETQPGRIDEPLRLGTLALGGPFLRARFALSF
jgi:hypothetical protein